MGGFSSKPSSSKPNKSVVVQVTAIDRTVLDLKNSRDRLQRYRKKLESDDAKLLQRAAKAKNEGNKETALGLLRLRKFKQQQAATCEEQLLNVLKMVETIDSKQNEAQILSAMAAGKDTLKRMHEETTVDEVLELMDQIAEEHATEQEISDILQNAVPELSATDEEAVEAELVALQAELDGTANIPVAPGHALPKIETPTKPTAEAAKEPERVAVPG